MKYHKLNNLENMMTNIVAEGREATWNEIDKIQNVFERIKVRKLYWQAIKKIGKG